MLGRLPLAICAIITGTLLLVACGGDEFTGTQNPIDASAGGGGAAGSDAGPGGGGATDTGVGGGGTAGADSGLAGTGGGSSGTAGTSAGGTSGSAASAGDASVDAPEDQHAVEAGEASVDALICPAHKGDCNNNPSDGCETDLTVSVSNCAKCGHICAEADHAAAVCIQGVCKLECKPAWGDCNNDPSDGCETNLSNTLEHCKTCGNSCPSYENATGECLNFACRSNCDAGWDDCDNNPSNGCEHPVNTNAECGYCGHDCLGKSCTNLKCEQEAVHTIASGATPQAIAVGSTDLFYSTTASNNENLRRVLKNAAGILPPTSVVTTPAQVDVSAIVVGTDGFLYWTITQAQGQIRRAKESDGTSYGVFAASQTGPSAIAANHWGVYWLSNPGVVNAQAYSTATPSPVATQQADPRALVVDRKGTGSGQVFWSLPNLLLQGGVGVAHKTIAQVSNVVEIRQIAFGAGAVFFTSSDGPVTRVDVASSTSEPLFHGAPSGGFGVAANDNRVYWTAGDPAAVGTYALFSAPVGGGKPIVMVTGLIAPGPVALDETHVYWAEQTSNGRIARVAK